MAWRMNGTGVKVVDAVLVKCGLLSALQDVVEARRVCKSENAIPVKRNKSQCCVCVPG